MPSEKSSTGRTLILVQQLGQSPWVRGAVTIIFFAYFYLVLDFPWMVMIMLSAALYWLIGWLARASITPEVDQDAVDVAHFRKVVALAMRRAEAIPVTSPARNDALQIATSSQSLLDAAVAKDTIRLTARYFQTLEDLYLPNLKAYAEFGHQLDTHARRQFEEIVLPRVVEQAKALEADIYEDERLSFEGRMSALAESLGMLPGVDLELPDSPTPPTTQMSRSQK